MFERITITLPKHTEQAVEKKSRELGCNRSELIRKAIASFLGLEDKSEEMAVRKYGPIYEALQQEDRKLTEEMMRSARKSLPPD